MDKLTVETTFFRSKSVHFPEEVTAKSFFRSISVQLNDDIGIFPLHTRSPHVSADSNGGVVFRTIPVHFNVFFSYLCTGKSVNTSTYMAGTVKEMSLTNVRIAVLHYCTVKIEHNIISEFHLLSKFNIVASREEIQKTLCVSRPIVRIFLHSFDDGFLHLFRTIQLIYKPDILVRLIRWCFATGQ